MQLAIRYEMICSMFCFAGTPTQHDPTHLFFEPGHSAPAKAVVTESPQWFDHYLGPTNNVRGCLAKLSMVLALMLSCTTPCLSSDSHRAAMGKVALRFEPCIDLNC